MKVLSTKVKDEMSKNLDLGKKVTESILYNKDESVMLFMASKNENLVIKCAITTLNYKSKVVAIEVILVLRKVNGTTYTQPVILEGYEIEDKDITLENLKACFNKIATDNLSKVELVLSNLKD